MNSKIALTFCLLLSIFVGDKVISAKNSDCIVPKHYEEIGCVVHLKDKTDCPTKFNCPEFATFALNKCRVKGRSFDVGQNVPDEVIPMCRADCHCSSHMHVECANVECPEDDYIDPDQAPTISLYNDLKQCCSVAQAPIDKIDNLPKCHVEGKSYHVGERIYPADSCLMCLCTQNFDNKTSFEENSNCVQINCGIEHDLHHIRAGCIPVYYKTPNCCPIDIKCPTKDDAIAKDASNFDNEILFCTFGDLTLKRGQKLESHNSCLTCECSIPPFLTCIQNPNCPKTN